jgi:signal transduction histidine kinase
MVSTYLIRRTALYGILLILIVIAYGLLVSGISLLFGSLIRPFNPWLFGLAAFIVALLLNPLRTWLQSSIDRVFVRHSSSQPKNLERFSSSLSKAVSLPEIIELLRRTVEQDLHTGTLHVFIFNSTLNQYCAQADGSGNLTSDLRFSPSSPLVEILSRRKDALFIRDLNKVAENLSVEHSRLMMLGSQLFVPLPGNDSLTGWLAVGSCSTGAAYSADDTTFLVSLAEQASAAVGRAQIVTDLQRRVQEMDVLTRIAQGVNVTLNFDDILELIYAQTNQIFPTCDFRITVFEKRNEKFLVAFFLENDERISDREGKILQEGIGLDFEILRSRRPILTPDYAKECWARGLLPDAQGIYAWMGVPLNSAGEAIGCISLGSRGPELVYTPEQLNLLQAISDQAAGALVKARLLRETEERAHQLTTLNEVGRNLTSTLELKPLLNRILTSAANILNCQAGSLFLIDPHTDELIFEVVIGPVADDLIGKRLPPGKGMVGQAVESGKPVIANDARRRKEWFNETDQQTGFTTQDLLAVPMKIKDRTLGVIEVINKEDGQPFTLDDQEILATFASQAAIAIENARLYTLTDQALSARVEELSVMQRIDRELNTSLDIQNAMEITLGWAIRQSAAQAGLIGFKEQTGFRIMASQGYTSDQLTAFKFLQDADKKYSAMRLPALEQALISNQPALIEFSSAPDASLSPTDGLIDSVSSQIAIPIRREDQAIGILLLEKTLPEPFTQDTIAFLSRLGDHAAIAISNAQLFSKVQETNLARSKFVSFVAHELKNPMASIKGYTELIAGGMAGPVNEMQSTFLKTIRVNVDRMNTIVSDLNDLTKIQVGALRLEFKVLAVQEILDEVTRSLERILLEKKQLLKVQLPSDLPTVWADPLRLTQVLTNLLSNAQKYSHEESTILIAAEVWEKDLEGPSGLKVIHLWVQDQGIGIDPIDQDKIFQQYFRTEISRETASGTGLGLNISQSLVKMQGGRIWFESTPGAGSTFHITIPVAESLATPDH